MSRELQHAHTMNQFKEVCHGTNCNASKAVPSHSAECKAEHDLAYGIKPSYRHDNPLRELKILRAENASLKAELAASEDSRKTAQEQLEQYKADLTRVTHERDRLLKGEYICQRCGIRKNSDYPPADF